MLLLLCETFAYGCYSMEAQHTSPNTSSSSNTKTVYSRCHLISPHTLTEGTDVFFHSRIGVKLLAEIRAPSLHKEWNELQLLLVARTIFSGIGTISDVA